MRTTQDQVDALADAYIAKLENKAEGTLAPGPSDHHDAWDNAIVLRENDYVVGAQVVVRSNGPDGQPNSGDEISAVRYHKTTAKEIRDHFVDKAVGGFGKFFAKEDEEEKKDPAKLVAQEDASNIDAPVENVPADVALPEEMNSTPQEKEKLGWKLPSLKFDWGEEVDTR